MKYMLFFLAILLVIPQVASAGCLSLQQTANLISLEQQLNISQCSLTNISSCSILDAVEESCSRTYTKTETDNLINTSNYKIDLQVDYVEGLIDNIEEENIDSLVDKKLDNYTGWFEDTIKITDLFHVIYNNTKPINITIGDEFARTDYVNEQLVDVRKWTRDTIEDEVTGPMASNPNIDPMTLFVGFIGLLVLLGYLYMSNKLPGQKQLRSRREPRQPYPTHNPRPAYVEEYPSEPDSEDSIANARLKRLKEEAEKQRLAALEREMKQVGEIEDNNTRDNKIQELLDRARKSIGEA